MNQIENLFAQLLEVFIAFGTVAMVFWIMLLGFAVMTGQQKAFTKWSKGLVRKFLKYTGKFILYILESIGEFVSWLFKKLWTWATK